MSISARAITHAAAAVCAVIVLCHPAHALKFANQFTEFDLPPKWNCTLEGPGWVCDSTDENSKLDAAIILAAKSKGDNDTLEKFQDLLKKPKLIQSPDGKSVASESKYVKVTEINGHPWVDSLQVDSEMPGYYTRYIATIKQDIAVLITYSIDKNKYQLYAPQFEDLARSIKVFRKTAAPAAPSGSPQALIKQVSLPGTLTQQNVFPETAMKSAVDTAAKPRPKAKDDYTMYLILGALIAAYIVYKKKKAAEGG